MEPTDFPLFDLAKNDLYFPIKENMISEPLLCKISSEHRANPTCPTLPQQGGVCASLQHGKSKSLHPN